MRTEIVYSAGLQLPQAPMTPQARRIRRLAQADDRAWFLGHPQARARIRAYQPGEFGAAHEDAWSAVLVRTLSPGVRVREPLARTSALGAQPITLTLDDDGETVVRQVGAHLLLTSTPARLVRKK